MFDSRGLRERMELKTITFAHTTQILIASKQNKPLT